MDWDEDGFTDLIVGDRLGGVHFFKRLSYGNIYLEEQDVVRVAGKPMDPGYNSSPCVADWNDDGLPDLLLGNLDPIPAGVYLFINQGSPGAPEYLETDTVFSGGVPIELTAAYPEWHDMDLDGLPDLIVGSSNGRIACFINRGSAGQPLFEESGNLQSGGGDIHVLSYSRPSACDWNGDGVPDLVVGDSSGMINLFTGVPPAGIHGSASGRVSLLENPVRGTASARVLLCEAAQVRTEAFSLSGRMLFQTDHGITGAGEHTFTADFSGYPSGLYLLRVQAGEDITLLRVVVAQ